MFAASLHVRCFREIGHCTARGLEPVKPYAEKKRSSDTNMNEQVSVELQVDVSD
jgi:hypothetical protein